MPIGERALAWIGKYLAGVRPEMLLDPREQALFLPGLRRRGHECRIPSRLIAQIRLKVGGGKLVLKHNIWYGFSRNLTGGTIYSLLFCLLNIIAGMTILKAPQLSILSTTLLCVYLTIWIFRKAILVQNAEAYARQLIAEFMSLTIPRRAA